MKSKFNLFRRGAVFYMEDMRPQRGASWRLDSRPAARFTSLPNAFFPDEKT
jgi:hypothetical protein